MHPRRYVPCRERHQLRPTRLPCRSCSETWANRRRRVLAIRPALPAGHLPVGPGRRTSRAVRGLLLTPWFAASTGFVIAAGMWLYSPHASISFPSAIGTVHCQLRGCALPGGKGSGSLASSAPGQRLRTKHRHAGTEQQAAAGKTAAGLRFTFAVLYQGHESFGAIITISGRGSLGSWRLAFRLPGTQIQNVFDAEWLQLASRDGGTASPFEGTFGRPSDPGERQLHGVRNRAPEPADRLRI